MKDTTKSLIVGASIVTGIVAGACGAVYYFCIKFLGYSIKGEFALVVVPFGENDDVDNKED